MLIYADFVRFFSKKFGGFKLFYYLCTVFHKDYLFIHY